MKEKVAYAYLRVSGKAPEMGKMIADILTNGFSTIIVEDLSRLAREYRIEPPRSKLRGILPRKEFCLIFDTLANPAAPVKRDLRFATTSHGECAHCCGSRKYAYLYSFKKSPVLFFKVA